MSAGTAIFSALAGDSGVRALVGTRVFPQLVPDRTAMPQVVYDIGDDQTDSSYDGRKMPRRTVTVHVVAADPDGADALADAVANALDEGQGVWGGVTVLGCWLDSSEPSVITVPDAQEATYFVIDQSYTLITR